MKSGLLGKPAKADEEHFVRRPFIGVFKVCWCSLVSRPLPSFLLLPVRLQLLSRTASYIGEGLEVRLMLVYNYVHNNVSRKYHCFMCM